MPLGGTLHAEHATPSGGPAPLCVTIVNYRTPDLTWACIGSVLAQAGDVPGLAVVVVDNASGDASVEVLSARIAAAGVGAQVRLVASPRNGGFSAGHNLAMADVPARAWLLLNSDATLEPGALATMMRALAESGPRDGIFSPRIVDSSGVVQTSLFRFHTPASEMIRGAATGPVTAALRRWDVPLTAAQADRAQWASFACVLLRAEMLAETGPLDEGFFLYYEDAEYCLRARRAGWRIVHVPDATCVHDEGGSTALLETSTRGKRLPAYYYASRARFLRLAWGPAGPVLGNLGWHAGRAVAGLRRLAGLGGSRSLEREARDLWAGLRRREGVAR